MMIGVDYHPSFQQMAFLVEETGEYSERRLNHSDGEAEKYYRDLKLRGVPARVGMEATGYSRWFERLLAELGFEVWIGDPAEIKTKRVKKQQTDRKDAQLLLKLMTHIATFRTAPKFAESDLPSTALASASVGADAHANHESAAGAGHERGGGAGNQSCGANKDERSWRGWRWRPPVSCATRHWFVARPAFLVLAF
jgi:hypothetical protein